MAMQTQVEPPADGPDAIAIPALDPGCRISDTRAWPAAEATWPGEPIELPAAAWPRIDERPPATGPAWPGLPGLGAARQVHAPHVARLARSATRLLGDVEHAFDQLHGKLVAYAPKLAEAALVDLTHVSRTCGPVTPRLMERVAGLVHRVVGLHLGRFASVGRAAAGKLALASVALREDVYRDGAGAVAELAQHAVAAGAALAGAARTYRAAIAELDDVLDELWARCGDRFHIRPPHQILPHIVARPSVRLYINPLLGVGGDQVVAGLPMPGGPAIIPLPPHLVHWEKPERR